MTDYTTLFDQQAKLIEIMTTPHIVVGDQLTVRDQFAMAALHMLSLEIHPKGAAEKAYAIADAMMEARK